MNKEWAEEFKKFQEQIKKEKTFDKGIHTLLKLRKEMLDFVDMVKCSFPKESYSLQPFLNANGYHNKTMAYSLYHIFRIEDIIINGIIYLKDKTTHQVLFNSYYKALNNYEFISTGNELVGTEIKDFSETLNIDVLYDYIHEVDKTTTRVLNGLSFKDLKTKLCENYYNEIVAHGSVSADPKAIWLIDYWKSKDILGLLLMPLSRHWIMHIEAFNRIRDKIIAIEKKKH